MYLSRIPRDAIETDWSSKSWYPPRGQIGEKWLPSTFSMDDQINLDSVQVLLILFCIQTGLAAWGMLASLCDKSEANDNKMKSSVN